MAGKIDAKLAELGIALPETPAPAGNYVPFVRTGNLVFISGQIATDGTTLHQGRLGDGVTVEGGRDAARACGLNILGQLRAACDGDLDRVTRCVRLGGFVCSAPDFTDQPKVINGASDLMVEVFGDAGRHARAAVGVPSLPLGVSVEIDAIFELS